MCILTGEGFEVLWPNASCQGALLTDKSCVKCVFETFENEWYAYHIFHLPPTITLLN